MDSSVAAAHEAAGFTAASVADAFLDACLLGVAAIQPGNVGFHRADRGVQAIDFVRSARVAATVIARPGLRVAERVHAALGAVRAAIGSSPNAGMILLAAPLVHTALIARAETEGFAERVADTLDRLAHQESAPAIAALRSARLIDHEHLPATRTLESDAAAFMASMHAASATDLIARQFTSAYADVREVGLPRLLQARSRGRDWRWTATEVYLGVAAKRADSHVARRHGERAAHALMEEAVDFDRTAARAVDLQRFQIELVSWDRRLKARRLHPRACADLTVATLLWAQLAADSTAAHRLRAAYGS